MTSATRANVASSFTVIKGAMIEETYAVFAAWDLLLEAREPRPAARKELHRSRQRDMASRRGESSQPPLRTARPR